MNALVEPIGAAKAGTIRLHLARHGQTPANREMRFPRADARLTGEGIAQAGRMAREFQRREVLVDTVLLSPTARTFQTMEIACSLQAARPRIIVVQGLREKDPGRATGARIPEARGEIDRISVRAGGESFPQFIERVESTFECLLEELRAGRIPGSEILLLGHSMVNRICFGVLQGAGGAMGLEGKSQINGGVKTVEIRR